MMEPNPQTAPVDKEEPTKAQPHHRPLKLLNNHAKQVAVGAGALAVSTVAFIIATVVLCYQVEQAKVRLKEASDVCTTADCIASAASLLEAMDPAADPCQDFYQFACGGWMEKHTLPESHSRWNQFDIIGDRVTETLLGILREKSSDEDCRSIASARVMYAACMDAEKIEQLSLTPLVELLASYGHWPMTISDWTKRQQTNSSFDWRSATASMRRVLGVNYLFNIYNYLDSNDTDKSVVYIDQPTLSLPRSTWFLTGHNPRAAALIEAYRRYATLSARAIRDWLQSDASDADIDADVAAMIRFEFALANITTRPEDRRNKTRMYNPIQLSTLQTYTDEMAKIANKNQSNIDWTRLINDIYSAVNVNITEDEQVIVVEIGYLFKFLGLIDETPPRVLANYIHWRLVQEFATETNKLMNNLAFEFSRVSYGTAEPQPRWRNCVAKINSFLGFAVSAKYIEKAFDEESKHKAQEMIDDLRQAFISMIDEATWMDEATKMAAREKAAAMKQFLAYPDWIKNSTALDYHYQELQEISRQSHFQNVRNALQFQVSRGLKALRKSTDHTTWITFPSIVNAYYSFKFNSITFPAAILQPPFFSKGRLAAMNYGAIGVVIGHEITHGFDDQGRQNDKDGKTTTSWWSDDTLSQYLLRAQCFVDQYSNYSLVADAAVGPIQMNGLASQSENIADNGGVREAYRAYRTYAAKHGRERRLPGLERYSPEQIFFIAYAHIWCGKETSERLSYQIKSGPHSPSRFRVLGPLSNSDDFVRLFGCPHGPMNRTKKCILW